MSGTVAGVANTGGSTLSYSDGCVSARVSSARLASPERKPYGSGGLHEELVRQSGVRYEYPTQPIPLFPAALITSAASFAILALQERGFRRLEAVVAAFIGVIVLAFAAQVFLAEPSPSEVAQGFIPRFEGPESVLLAVGILGATVMPHVIYLHSALTQHRVVGATDEEKRRIFHFELVELTVSKTTPRHLGLHARRPG